VGPLRRSLAVLLAMIPALASATPASAQGLVTEPSAHSVRGTLDRFEAAVRAEGWVVFTEIDHAAAAREAGLPLHARTVVIFGNPRSGTGAMAEHPTLALDLPMRALVWEDAEGRVFVTRSTGADIAERVFARHGMAMPEAGRQATEALLAGLVRQATR
jgi:uncharacterized protein (DUF302 family)